MNVVELVFGSFKKSLDLNLWLYYFAAILLSIVAVGLVAFAALVPAAAVLFVFKLQLVSFALLALIGILGFALFFFVNAVFEAAFLFVARDFLATGKLSLSEAFNKAIPRAKPLCIANIIVFFAVIALFVLLMLPALVPLLGALPNLSPSAFLSPGNASSVFLSAIMPAIIIALVMLLVFFAILFLFLPWAFLITPIIAFENLSALAGIKKAFSIAKKSYGENLVAAIFFVVFSMAIGIVFFALNFVVELLSLVPFLFLLFAALSVALSIIQILLSTAFSNIFVVNYYKANKESKSAALQPPKKKKIN